MIAERNLHPSLRSRLGIDINPWGRTLYVSSTHTRATDSNNGGEDKLHPLKTLGQALTQVLANDLIVVGAGHSEIIAAATSIPKGNVKIVGLGRHSQTTSSTPVFSFATLTTAKLSCDVGGIELENLTFTCGIDAQTAMVVLGTASLLRRCMVLGTSSAQPTTLVSVPTAGDDTVIEDCYLSSETAGAAQAVLLAIGANDVTIRRCHMRGDFSAANIKDGGAINRVLIDDNRLLNENAVDANITLNASSTGMISNNRCHVPTDAQTTWITAAACAWSENYGTNQPGETGKLIGAASV